LFQFIALVLEITAWINNQAIGLLIVHHIGIFLKWIEWELLDSKHGWRGFAQIVFFFGNTDCFNFKRLMRGYGISTD
jgi:hypothetical protein